MKFSTTHALAGLALIVMLVHFSKKQSKVAAAGPGQPGNAIDSGAQWWSYAGSWATP